MTSEARGPSGLFIVFEGLDGSGKDSILTRLLPLFYSEGSASPVFLGKSTQVARTREPTASNPDGRFLLDKLADGTLGLEKNEDVTARFVADRKHHSEEIRQLLRLGYVVLTSRYDLSTFAYQGNNADAYRKIYSQHQYGENGALVPDLTLFFDVPARTALERISGRGGKKEFFEDRVKLERIAKSYREAAAFLTKKDGRALVRIDARKPIEAVTRDTEKAIGEFLARRRISSESSSSKKILIIKQTSLGDVLHSTVALRILKRSFPKSRITVMTDKNSSGIFSANPSVDKLILTDFATWEKTWWKRPFATLREIGKSFRDIRSQGFDLAYDLQGLLRSVIFLYAARSTKKWVKGNWPFLGGFRNKHLHAVHEIRNVLETSGVKTFPIGTELALSPKDNTSAGKILGSFPQKNRPLVLVSPFTRWPSKDWSPERFSELIGLLQKDFQVVITGSAADLDKTSDLLPAGYSTKAVLNLAGKLSLGEFAAVLKKCALLISGDSFPVHAASALGVPVVELFGPTDERRVGPMGTSFRILRSPRCRICYDRTCPKRCLDDIKPKDVIAAVEELLQPK